MPSPALARCVGGKCCCGVFRVTGIATEFKNTAFIRTAVNPVKKKLLSILVCPVCKGSLIHKPRQKLLICEKDKLAYPIRNGIPVLLHADASKIAD